MYAILGPSRRAIEAPSNEAGEPCHVHAFDPDTLAQFPDLAFGLENPAALIAPGTRPLRSSTADRYVYNGCRPDGSKTRRQEII